MGSSRIDESEQRIGNFNKFAVLISTFFSIAFILIIFTSSYTEIKPTEALSYHLEDGWCAPDKEGFGKHCFGDYYAPIQSLSLDSPYEGLIRNAPPFAFLLLKPFAWVYENNPGRSSLFLFLAVSILCLLIPIFHMLKKRMISYKYVPILLVITFASGPVVSLLDRGNILVFTVPLVYLFFYHAREEEFAKATIYAILFTLIKPQLFLLALVFLALKQYKMMFNWALGSLVGSLASFLFFPHDFIINFQRWVSATLSYRSVGAVGVLEPVNVSLKSSIDVLFNIFGSVINQNLVSALCYLCFILATIKFIRDYSTRDDTYNCFLALLFPILFVGTTYHYYLSLLIVPLIFLLLDYRGSHQKNSGTKVGLMSRGINNLTTVVFIVILTPIVLPWSISGRFNDRGWENISSHWLLAQWVLSVVGVYLYFSKGKQLKSE